MVGQTLINGTVVAITGSGRNRWGRPPNYGYEILLASDGGGVVLSSPFLHRIGDQVTVERIVRSNGYEMYQLLPASD